jgi:hypothetical protein
MKSKMPHQNQTKPASKSRDYLFLQRKFLKRSGEVFASVV